MGYSLDADRPAPRLRFSREVTMVHERSRETFHTIVIGAGQAGLSVGYYLARQGRPFVILDANQRVGDSWRQRWNSLRLFTPARFDGLVGMPFPAPAFSFPTKDEMADYLEGYARHFQLPIRSGIRVARLTRVGTRYVIEAGAQRFEADHVVVAMSSYQIPRMPAFAKELASDILQMHSSEYRNPQQLKPGGVLLVGAGNSGAEIAIDVVREHQTWVSGRDTGHVPFRIDGTAARLFLLRFLFRVVFHRLLTVRTPIGRRARRKMFTQGTTLIRVKPKELASAGIERVPKVSGVTDGRPTLEDGRVLDVANVIWCTGFGNGLSWIDMPIFESDGEPRHESGIVTDESGLYFVGLHFLHSFSSTMIHGIARDAKRITDTIEQRTNGALLKQGLRPLAQLNREPPRIPKHQQSRSIVTSHLVDE
jgi:putative flavoprotein involved in K+ transport